MKIVGISEEDVKETLERLVNDRLTDPSHTFHVFFTVYDSSDITMKIQILEGMTILYRSLLIELRKLHKKVDQGLSQLLGNTNTKSNTSEYTNLAMKILQWITKILLHEKNPELCRPIAFFYFNNKDDLPFIPFTRLESKFEQMHQVLYNENVTYGKVSDSINEELNS